MEAQTEIISVTPLQEVKNLQKELLDMLNNNTREEAQFFQENSTQISALLEKILKINSDSNLGLIGRGLYIWHQYYSITKNEHNYVIENDGSCLRVLLLGACTHQKYIMYNYHGSIVYFKIEMSNMVNLSIYIQNKIPYDVEHLSDTHEE